MDTEKLRQSIGPRADWYLARFDKIERAGGGLVPGWNWPAFACSTAWFTYRRLDSWATGNFFFLLFGMIVSAAIGSVVFMGAFLFVAFAIIPMYANAIYYGRLKAGFTQADAAQGEAAEKKRLRPPSAWTLVSAVLSGALTFVLSFLAFGGPGAYADYTPRARVAEGVSVAASLKTPVTEYYQQHKKLPGAQEAQQFRHAEAMKYTASVGWDPERKAIVATMGDHNQGKRFEIAAVEKGGTLEWVCRPIDLEPKYLPARCR